MLTSERLFFLTGCLWFQGHKLAISWIGTIASERTQLFCHHVLVHHIYSHIPYFHPEAGPHHMNKIGPGKDSAGIVASHGGIVSHYWGYFGRMNGCVWPDLG